MSDNTKHNETNDLDRRTRMTAFIGRVTFKFFNSFFKFRNYLDRIINFSKKVVGSLIGLLITAYLFTPHLQESINKFTDLKTFFFTIGGLIGTMLALIISLSIIPIQKATEAFSPSVVNLYRSDSKSILIYFLLAFFSVSSFVAGINGIPYSKPTTLLPIAIFLLACSFDLIRWHYRRVSLLLTPSFAIKKIFDTTIHYIKLLQKRTSIVANLQYLFFLWKDKSDNQKNYLETALYSSNPYYAKQIKYYLDQIAEIVNKSILKGETNSCEDGINSIVRIAQEYLLRRKDNIILIPSPEALLLASETDAKDILTPVYEHLKDINSNAVRSGNENVSLNVIEVYALMAIFTANLKAKSFRKHSAPITFAPIFYMRECIKVAQEKGLFEVGFQASGKFLFIASKAPKNVDPTSIYFPLLDGWVEIIQKLFISKNEGLVNSVLADLMKMTILVLEQKHFQARFVIENALEKIYTFLPISIFNEALQKQVLSSTSFSPYDLTSDSSIGYLVAHSTKLIENVDEDKPWLNPYSQFKTINEVIYRHFRNVAENIQFGDSFFMYHITETILHIAKVYLSVIEKKATDDFLKNQELIGQITWYSAFFWVVFKNAKTINFQRAEHACDALAWIGISFYLEDFDFVIKNSISNISSIIESCSKFDQALHSFRMADLMKYLWILRIFLESKENHNLVNEIDSELAKKPNNFMDDDWIRINAELENRKGYIQNEISEISYDNLLPEMPMHRSLPLLKSILN